MDGCAVKLLPVYPSLIVEGILEDTVSAPYLDDYRCPWILFPDVLISRVSDKHKSSFGLATANPPPTGFRFGQESHQAVFDAFLVAD